ncbi:MAG: hypothetical protein HY754_12465, partial [Nitrospirae bacterium]|nr:hypothetical protein [Nitrospirota bacterium]
MKDDRENNGDPDILINHLLSRDQSTEKGAGQLDIRHIRERFLNALKEISHLEKVLEEKNTQLAVASKEKDRLLHALNKAFGEKKRLHDRLADFDVLRNMEIVEFKQSSEKIIGEINRLRKENSEMLDDVFEKDAMLDRKELKIRDVQDDLYTAVEVLRKTESRYKEIEQERDSLNERLKDMERRNTENSGRLEEYGKLLDNADFEKDAVARERDSLSEKLNMTVHDLTGKLEAEYQGRIEVLNNTITDLRTGLEKDLQLKNEMIAGLESRYETDMKKASLRIDRLTAGKAEVGNEKINENASLKNEIAL